MADALAGVIHRTVLASDGLKLAVEDAGPPDDGGRVPLLCLAGLTRTKRDFHNLRDFFAFHPDRPRRVVSLDTRGRGESDHAADVGDYSVQREADDAAQVACALGVHNTVIVGTSRGGILAMVLALTRPGLMAGSVLNDIGPRIAGAGLARLKRQLPAATFPSSWEEAEARVRTSLQAQFPAFTDEDWFRYARLTFADEDGRPGLAYDPRLLEPLSALPDGLPFLDLSGPFKALVTRPMLMLHGEHSDLLDEAILADAVAMGAQAHTLSGQGHAPSLRGNTLSMIDGFLAEQGL
jgi:pimeloyl-ACP methyl ester carboxylesterase